MFEKFQWNSNFSEDLISIQAGEKLIIFSIQNPSGEQNCNQNLEIKTLHQEYAYAINKFTFMTVFK